MNNSMLSAFADRAWFVLYKTAPLEGGRLNKLPIGIDGRNSNAQDPATWMHPVFAEAYAAVLGCGVGVVLHNGCQVACIDLDHCVAPDGSLSVFAQTLVAMFPGAYREVSVSGTGLHIFFRYTGELPRHGTRGEGIEVYTVARFVALGTGGQGDPLSDHTSMLHVVLATLVNQPAATAAPSNWTDGPDPEFPGGCTDEELIATLRNDVVARGDGAPGRALWDGDEDALALAYPSDTTGQAYNASSADQALANKLARATGFDCERVARLLRESGLARSKHDRENYIRATVLRACDGLAKAREGWRKQFNGRNFLAGLALSPATVPFLPAAPGVTPVAAPVAPARQPRPARSESLGKAQIEELFRDCVYVSHDDAILTRNNDLLSERQFNHTFSDAYWFPMDHQNAKFTKKAWECFHESGAYKPAKVDRQYFNPDDAPRSIRSYGVDGRELNSWSPPNVVAKQGDISRYMRILETQLPDARDRRILLSWMASCVQNPGKKFRWSPYLQGSKGCGKSTHAVILSYCVGEEYSVSPTAKHLDKQFNAMLDRKVLACVDDINLTDRGGLWDTLKPMITETKLEIERKGVDSYTAKDMCLKFFFNGNYKDGLPMSQDERRLAPFFIRASKEQMANVGLDHTFYDWLKAEGNAALAYFFQHYEIAEEFDPARGCVVAPTTSDTAEAVALSLPPVVQALAESIKYGEVGADGRVTRMQLELFLHAHRAARTYPPARRGELMALVGFGGFRCEQSPTGAAVGVYLRDAPAL